MVDDTPEDVDVPVASVVHVIVTQPETKPEIVDYNASVEQANLEAVAPCAVDVDVVLESEVVLEKCEGCVPEVGVDAPASALADAVRLTEVRQSCWSGCFVGLRRF